jgi:hypothetical protein
MTDKPPAEPLVAGVLFDESLHLGGPLLDPPPSPPAAFHRLST